MIKKPTEKQLAARERFKKQSSRILNKDPYWMNKGGIKERTFEQYEKKADKK
jgi:hypothetical protein